MSGLINSVGSRSGIIGSFNYIGFHARLNANSGTIAANTWLEVGSGGSANDVDPSFVTAAYSIAGLDLGYAMYDGDNGGEETQMGVGTSVMGMNAGVTFANADLATDVDYMRVSLSKGMGAASFGIDYTETDVSGTDTGDTDVWNFMYIVGF